MSVMSRRNFIVALGCMAVPGSFAVPVVAGDEVLRVAADSNCGCCIAWADHLRDAGFSVEMEYTHELASLKDELGVPGELRSCHTARIKNYIIEGHVPAEAITRLLFESPNIRGLAVPGMPIGSPGMEVPGVSPERYDVIAFGAGSTYVFESFLGARRV